MYQNLDEIEAKGKEIKQLIADGKIEEAKRSADVDFQAGDEFRHRYFTGNCGLCIKQSFGI
ncbi:MAG: hypothetical protein ACLTBV_11205 [Enterocloster bolteae]